MKQDTLSATPKMPLYKYLLLLFIAIILSGCYTSELVKEDNPLTGDIKLITRIDFKDGKKLDFDEFENKNHIISIDKEKITYKNPSGVIYSIPANEIARIYQDNFSPWKSVVFIIGTAAAAVLLLFKF
jgi:hypothetical protein